MFDTSRVQTTQVNLPVQGYIEVPDSPNCPYDSNRGRRWPSSASMMPSPGDTEVSVYLGSVMAENDLQSDDLLEGHERHGLMRFPVQAARDAGFGVLRDPVLDTSRPLKADPAHALLGSGGPNDPDAAHRQARQADEQRYLELHGTPWDHAVYVTAPHR